MNVLIKGAGDLATGVAVRLFNSGFSIIMTEIQKPTTVRRTVAFSTAVYTGLWEVDGVQARVFPDLAGVLSYSGQGVGVIIDPDCNVLASYKPDVVVDAIIAKRNINTSITDSGIVIALGPGFTAGVDCHAVIETQRGHYLGRVIYDGSAIPNTGVPGDVGGFSCERIIRAPRDGVFKAIRNIGDTVSTGQPLADVDGYVIEAEIDGVVRGMLYDGLAVHKGMKCGDIDPRCEVEHCYCVSDKARSIGGGVLEAILHLSFGWR